MTDPLDALQAADEARARRQFDGHPGRECGEHRTTGERAWCFDCTTWCYLTTPCAGCERPTLLARLRAAEAERDKLRKALSDIGALVRGHNLDAVTVLREVHRRSYAALHPEERS